jgi:hypothetical protein
LNREWRSDLRFSQSRWSTPCFDGVFDRKTLFMHASTSLESGPVQVQRVFAELHSRTGIRRDLMTDVVGEVVNTSPLILVRLDPK